MTPGLSKDIGVMRREIQNETIHNLFIYPVQRWVPQLVI